MECFCSRTLPPRWSSSRMNASCLSCFLANLSTISQISSRTYIDCPEVPQLPPALSLPLIFRWLSMGNVSWKGVVYLFHSQATSGSILLLRYLLSTACAYHVCTNETAMSWMKISVIMWVVVVCPTRLMLVSDTMGCIRTTSRAPFTINVECN